MTQVDMLASSSAIFSDDMAYRYALHRMWELGHGLVVFVMLNPSTADAHKNDPTVERCERFAKGWGYASLAVVNLFGLRSTDPKALYDHPDPVGPENDMHLRMHANLANLIVCAWGNHGGRRAATITQLLRDDGNVLHCLGRNKTRQPVHPLYQPKSAMPIIFEE